MKKVIVFAGPNGSGKSTVIAKQLKSGNLPELYICPDEIAKYYSHIDDIKERYLTAMRHAESIRFSAIENGLSFSFETVFSTKEKLEFLKYVKSKGYLLEAIYVTTKDPSINIKRVEFRASTGGHAVPKDKIISRYKSSMSFLPDIIEIADNVQVYDNSDDKPLLIFSKINEKLYLLNKEYRNTWVNKYISQPLLDRKYELSDLTAKETAEFLKNL